MARRLVELHTENVIVKDLKPEKILLEKKFNCVVVADFGFSELKTTTLHMPMIANYMVPEQWDPRPFGGVGATSLCPLCSFDE